MKSWNHLIVALCTLALAFTQNLAQSISEPFAFTTLAGGGGFSTDGPASTARFWGPASVAVDSAGNLFVADAFSHTIRKVKTNGTAELLAGSVGTAGSADGTGSDARFYQPLGVAVDGEGNVYVADTGNNTIRKVTSAGVVTTLAGLAGTSGNANGTGSAARFYGPFCVAVDGGGNVYAGDAANNTIRKITPAGVVTTLAGQAGSFGSANGTGSSARFSEPYGVAVDVAGNVYVADSYNNTIRKVTPAGVVTTLAGIAGTSGSADGIGSAARFNFPAGVTVDNAGRVYVTDGGNRTIRQLTLTGNSWEVKTVAGLAPNPGDVDGIGSAARFNEPFGLAVDSAGNIYVPEIYGHIIRKVTPTGADWVVTTVAGTAGNPGFADGAGLQARFRGPSGVAVDPAGNVYVADEINHTIRKVSATGEVTTLAGAAGYGGSNNGTGTAAGFRAPTGVASDSAGNVYVADAANNTIRRITPAGAVTTLAGLADNEGDADGTGSAARFKYPNGLTVDSTGNVYVADSFNHTIRKVTPAGVVTTLAGLAGESGSADGTGSNARFNTPTSVAVDGQNNVYVTDTWNHTVRKVTPAQVVTTLAGLAGASGSTDGAGSAARFASPTGLTVDGAGNVYVADTYNNKIRKVTPTGVVTTLAGSEGTIGTTDATGCAARFGNPAGIAVDSTGNLYVADFYFNTIRKGSPALMIYSSGFTNGQFGFHLTGPVGKTVVIEASTDLSNWLPVWTNTFPGALDFIDPQSGYSHRVYRARLP